MPCDPNIHHRKSIRLKGYDYSQSGLYFFTICVHDKKCLFGEIVGDEKNMELDVFQIMPNHVHGIIILTDAVVGTIPAVAHDNNGLIDEVVGAGFTPAHDNNNLIDDERRAGASPAPTKTISDIVGAYKSLVANDCLVLFKQKNPDKMMGKLWQRNYHDHIIRDEQSYKTIAEYIIHNPAKWMDDKFYRE